MNINRTDREFNINQNSVMHSIPLIGWGDRKREDISCEIRLLDQNPLVGLITTPNSILNQYKSNLWWEEDGSRIGISVGDQSVTWHSSDIREYIIDISYPVEFSGTCGLGVLSEQMPEKSRAAKFLCLEMPYSSASLEILLRVCSVLSKINHIPISMIQWPSSR